MMSIGAVAVAPSNPNIVWVGTGEANNRQSSSWGDGVYKSTDAGTELEAHGPRRHAPHRPHRRSPDESRRRLRRGRRTPVGIERRTRRLQDHRRRRDVAARCCIVDDNTGATDLVIDPQDPADAVRGDLSAAAQGMGIQRRRAGQRHLPLARRRRDMDEAHERTACRRQGAHRPRHLPRAIRASSTRVVEARGPRRRRLPQRRRRRHVGGVVVAQSAADVLQPDPHRSEGPQPRLPARLEPRLLHLRRRRQDVPRRVQHACTPKITRSGSIPTTPTT